MIIHKFQNETEAFVAAMVSKLPLYSSKFYPLGIQGCKEPTPLSFSKLLFHVIESISQEFFGLE